MISEKPERRFRRTRFRLTLANMWTISPPPHNHRPEALVPVTAMIKPWQ